VKAVPEIIEAFISHVAVPALLSTCIFLFNSGCKKKRPNNSDSSRREEWNLWLNPPQQASYR
jgi:hypothetical protein